MRVAVIGGSGTLGAAVVAAASSLHEVVAISRRPPAGLPATATHRKADVTTGEGLQQALEGVDVIVDAANAMRGATEVLVEGTRRSIEIARASGVKHFLGISIVGIDDAPFPYYQTKVAQERVITEGGIPWSILRTTQFHDLVAMLARGKLGVALAPRGAQMQPVDVRDVATFVLDAIAAGPSQRLPEVAGPEVLEMSALFDACKRALGAPRWVLRVPLPGKRGAFLRAGGLCNASRAVGTRTFASWLTERQR